MHPETALPQTNNLLDSLMAQKNLLKELASITLSFNDEDKLATEKAPMPAFKALQLLDIVNENNRKIMSIIDSVTALK